VALASWRGQQKNFGPKAPTLSCAERDQLIEVANKVSQPIHAPGADDLEKEDWTKKKAKSLEKSLAPKTTKPPEGG